jgi:hypothetical protein
VTIIAPGGASAEAKSGNSAAAAAADDSSRAPSRTTVRRSREPPSAGAVAPHNARLGLRPSLTEVAAGHAHDLAPGMLSTPKRRVGRSDIAVLAVITVAAKNGDPGSNPLATNTRARYLGREERDGECGGVRAKC